jgi:hypothetical protein
MVQFQCRPASFSEQSQPHKAPQKQTLEITAMLCSTKARGFKIGPPLSLGQEHQNLLRDYVSNVYNLIQSSNIKMERCVINKGKAVITFDLSFKRFNLVLDFKYFNC